MRSLPARLVSLALLVAAATGCASTPRETHGKTLERTRAAATAEQTRTCRDIAMPERVSTDDARLVLNGMAVKRVTIFGIAVFVGGLYLEQETRDLEGLLTAPQHRRLVLRFVRRVSASQIRGGIRAALVRNVGDRLAAHEADVQRLEQALPSVQSGDELVFDQRTAGRFTMSLNGAALADFDPAFAEICLLAFLGPQGNLALREGLIGGSCDE